MLVFDDSAGTVEYQTLISCTVELKRAVYKNLNQLSGCLLAKGLIRLNDDSDLRNEKNSEESRAATLVEIIQRKVDIDPQSYYTFIKILEEVEGSDYHCNTLRILRETFDRLNGNIIMVKYFINTNKQSYADQTCTCM